MKVYKFLISPHGTCTLDLPAGAQILDVRFQAFESLQMWVLGRYGIHQVKRTFESVFTGEELPENAVGRNSRTAYIASAENDAGLVVHVFEAVSK